MDLSTAFDLENRGEGRILVRFGDLQDFIVHVIYATDALIATRPDAIRGFLKGWFETIAFMRKNKAETVAIAKDVIDKDADIVGRTYDEVMPMYSDDGRFKASALSGAGEILRRAQHAAGRARHEQALHRGVPAGEVTVRGVALMIMQRWIWAAGAIAVALIFAGGAASAQTTIRLGKAQANQFAFVPADVGADTGIFKKHGIDLEISAFTGDAKEMQALTAGSLDIALGGGPALPPSSRACR